MRLVDKAQMLADCVIDGIISQDAAIKELGEHAPGMTLAQAARTLAGCLPDDWEPERISPWRGRLGGNR